ncbi:FadR/GntR family transcriptional regulator [Bacillus sp. PS06]|uniref:FadR/GntR family transcriptional regulator n=1 Tax=Bacillus sp. PS06 TaxID=2764176 RepID=UPI0017829F2D|nr:FadR/GntR family transcriptional regulator [Bacillus sp. PS06]MBD8067938.1 FadR family transcriptional regulator [Bacillus sp. PS06]
MSLKPIKKKKLFEEIILAIEEYIQGENIQPGHRLPSENELASIFQVSKTAVREAMSVLQANGVIEKRTGSGIFLKELEGETIAERVTKNLLRNVNLQEVLEFRRGIEVEAVALTAQRATPQEIVLIEQAHLHLLEAQEANQLGSKEDYLFHYQIILASHNTIYKDVYESISSQLDEGIRLSKMQSARLPGRIEEAQKEHEEIIEMIKARDPRAASEAMRKHLMQNENKMMSLLKNS